MGSLLLVLAVGTSGCIVQYSPYLETPTRLDAWDGNLLVGNLTWSSGKGGIAWDAGASEPLGGPSDAGPARDALPVAGSTLRGAAGQDPAGARPGPDEFVSEPLPRNLPINVSRLLQLDLVVTPPDPTMALVAQARSSLGSWGSFACPVALDVEVLIDGERIAGAVAGQLVAVGGQTARVCAYRMPSEVPSLSKGDVVTVRILHVDQSYHFRYVTQGAVRSQLRIPFYTGSEALFRDAVPTAPPGDRGPSDGSMGGIWLAAAMLLSPALAGRGRRGAAMMALAVLLAALAGCAAPPQGPRVEFRGDGKSGLQGVVIVRDDGGLSSAGNATLLGTVFDDSRVAVAGAKVELRAAGRVDATDSQGRFEFRNVAPGAHVLRVLRVGYVPVDVGVEARAGQVQRLEVRLHPVTAATVSAPDPWGAATTLPLLELDLVPICRPESFVALVAGQAPCEPNIEFPVPGGEPGSPRVVAPGTSRVVVRLSWSPAALGLAQLGLMFQDSHDRANWSQLAPRAPNVPFVIPTNWEMTDAFFQRFSSWRFQAYAAPRDYPGVVQVLGRAAWPASLPKIHVSGLIERGAIPLLPPLPDPWGGAAFKELGPEVWTELPRCSFNVGSPPLRAEPGYSQSPNRPVPNGTVWLEVRVRPDRAQAPGKDFVVAYKPAHLPPDAPESAYKVTEKGVRDGDRFVWRIKLAPGEADGLYDWASLWRIHLLAADPSSYCTGYGVEVIGGSARSTLIAHRDALPA